VLEFEWYDYVIVGTTPITWMTTKAQPVGIDHRGLQLGT